VVSRDILLISKLNVADSSWLTNTSQKKKILVTNRMTYLHVFSPYHFMINVVISSIYFFSTSCERGAFAGASN